jgi:hypothetical protein
MKLRQHTYLLEITVIRGNSTVAKLLLIAVNADNTFSHQLGKNFSP